MPQPGADQPLDDVLFDDHHAQRAGHVDEQPGEAVVQVGMDQNLGLLRSDQAKGDNGGLGRGHVVIPMRQAEGEILAQIADGGGTGGNGAAGIFQRAG